MNNIDENDIATPKGDTSSAPKGKLYYSIGEVAQMLHVNASLLRYWESEFDCIRPTKNKKGNRYYTQKTIDTLRRIQHLTKDCGYTLEGAREQLRHKGNEDDKKQLIETLTEIKSFLESLRQTL